MIALDSSASLSASCFVTRADLLSTCVQLDEAKLSWLESACIGNCKQMSSAS